MPTDYMIKRDGTVTIFHGLADSTNNYHLRNQQNTAYNKLTTLETNAAGLVKFPDSMDFFGRYGTVDTGGKNGGVKHGKGDHYLLPHVAAALFGVAAVLKDTHGIHISFGDMSADNGTDPWSPGFNDHAGHGHGSRSGMDVDFRYIDKNGNSFHGKMNDDNFSVEKNDIVYRVAKTFNFNSNYQGTLAKLAGVPTASGHNDHGHLGYGS